MEKVMVRINVNVQDYLPNDMEKIYAVGNNEKLGAWDPNEAMTLRRSKYNPTYRSFRKLPIGTDLEFKIIRTNDWSHVELGAFCEEVSNHVYHVDGPMDINITVYNWKEM